MAALDPSPYVRHLVAPLAWCCLVGAASATPLGTNLIVNGDASAGTTPVGWSVVPDSQGLGICVTTAAGQATTVGLPTGVSIGVRSFWGCGTGLNVASTKSMSQLLDISDLASQIDDGQIEAEWSTLLQSRITDRVTATLRFLDGASALLQSSSYIDTNGSADGGASYQLGFDWSSITDTIALPVGTRFIDVRFSFTRPGGFSTDAFADNISLVLNTTGGGSTVPEPGTLALLAAGVAGAGLARRRRVR